MNYQRQGLQHRENRAALFAASPPSSSGRNSPLPLHFPRDLTGAAGAGARTAEEIESQNESHLQGLSAKVKMLKEITVNIGNEVRDSTKMLTGMNDDFDQTGGFLGGTMKKMNKMAKRQGGQWCLWMGFLLICFTVFFWTWVWRR